MKKAIVHGMKEFNNRERANQFAEYITGESLRKYVAEKVKKYANDNPTVFDGACGSGQLEQFVNCKKLYGVEVQKEACEVAKENYADSDINHESFFNYNSDVIADCVIMNPPFSIKFNGLTEEEKNNIQQEFAWKKSGVVDDIFILKSLKHCKRYGFYIAFPGITYRQQEKKLREIVGCNLLELNTIRNAFKDTNIEVAFLVIDKEKKENFVLKEIYDCKNDTIVHSEKCDKVDDLWLIPREEIKENKLTEDDVLNLEVEKRRLALNRLRSDLALSQFVCSLDERLPKFNLFVNDCKKVISEFDNERGY